MSNSINFKDITIVVQGPVGKSTLSTLASCHNNLPKATTILSTWEGENTKDLKFDKIIFNKDPGFSFNEYCYIDNRNRQIESTKNGVLAVETPYCLKIRSDIDLVSKNFLNFWEEEPLNREEKFSFLKKKVIFSSIFTRWKTDLETIGCPFHFSDWVHFGLTEDILKMWDIPLDKKKNTTTFLPNNYANNLTVEQYIMIEVLKKTNKFPIIEDYNVSRDVNLDLLKLEEGILINNFIMLPPSKWKILLNKAPYSSMIKKDKYPKFNKKYYFFTEEDIKIIQNKREIIK